VGRLADLQARLRIRHQPQPQHVQPDRAGRRRGVDLQRGRDAAAGYLPAAMRSMMDTVPVYFEAAAVIMVLVLLDR